MSAADEILDIVDENDVVVGQSRAARRMRAVFATAACSSRPGTPGAAFVHRRTPTKLVFPSLYDMFVGGVVGAGESYDSAALREAEEELGVSGLPQPVPLFKFLYDNGSGQDLVVGRLRGPLRAPGEPPDGGGRLARLPHRGGGGTHLTDWTWVPDGLAACRAPEGPPGDGHRLSPRQAPVGSMA